tara:strand:- start:5442 stop:6011 length:570 start_codon:yes stop_codon:yes gene_type:complete
MNPKVWKLISDYMYETYYGLRKLDKMYEDSYEEDYLPLYGKAEAVYGKGPSQLNPLQRARLKLLPVDPPSWTKLLQQKEDEIGGDPYRGINWETGRMQWMDDLDDIDWTDPEDVTATGFRFSHDSDQYYAERPHIWKAIQREMAEEKKETSKKKSSHSRRGGGGGALPPDLIGSGKTLPRGFKKDDKKY